MLLKRKCKNFKYNAYCIYDLYFYRFAKLLIQTPNRYLWKSQDGEIQEHFKSWPRTGNKRRPTPFSLSSPRHFSLKQKLKMRVDLGKKGSAWTMDNNITMWLTFNFKTCQYVFSFKKQQNTVHLPNNWLRVVITVISAQFSLHVYICSTNWPDFHP